MKTSRVRSGALAALLPCIALTVVLASPPSAQAETEPAWVTAFQDTELYSRAIGGEVLGIAHQWTSYRVDGPTVAGRIWVWSPYTHGHAWIPADSVGPGEPPTQQDIGAFWESIWKSSVLDRTIGTARDYLYVKYPDLAPVLDCIASKESGWQNIPNHQGSGAFGPFQFLRSTFLSTRVGQTGADWRNPYDQVDAAVDMVLSGRLREWAVANLGLC